VTTNVRKLLGDKSVSDDRQHDGMGNDETSRAQSSEIIDRRKHQYTIMIGS
jgi:hypothetical protein